MQEPSFVGISPSGFPKPDVSFLGWEHVVLFTRPFCREVKPKAKLCKSYLSVPPPPAPVFFLSLFALFSQADKGWSGSRFAVSTPSGTELGNRVDRVRGVVLTDCRET